MVVAGAGFGRRAGRMVLLIPKVLVVALGKDTAAVAAGSAAGLAVAGVRFPSSSLRGRQGPFPPRKWEKSTLCFSLSSSYGRKHAQTQTPPRTCKTAFQSPNYPNIVYQARSASPHVVSRPHRDSMDTAHMHSLKRPLEHSTQVQLAFEPDSNITPAVYRCSAPRFLVTCTWNAKQLSLPRSPRSAVCTLNPLHRSEITCLP